MLKEVKTCLFPLNWIPISMRLLYFILTLFLFSCAGYRFQQKDNPFKQYGIKSIAVPMFYNQSTLPNITSYFTKEIYNMISDFDGLKIVNARRADAVLVGIIESEDRLIDTIVPGSPRSVENLIEDDLESTRGEFYVPSSSDVRLRLKLIVIKAPTEEEIKFLRSKKSSKAFLSSKIIFKEEIALSRSFTREIFGKESKVINHSQNKGALKKTIVALSKEAAETFKEMILYAF